VNEGSSSSEGLYECVAPVVNRVVWMYLSRDPERDDIAQDILVAILRGAGDVDDPRKLEGWAARVAHNRIFSVFRRRKILRFFSLDAVREREPEVRHADFEGRELLARAQAILERMPLAERMPFTLQLLGDASLAEVAATCGCSERTARRRLKDARERFVRLASRDPLLAARLSEKLAREGDVDE
jgi:RNA polymerase sigma factor (sigma-70 family)